MLERTRRAGRLGAMRKRAFTLIELLVVIAIISLLVAILMPSLQQAKCLATIAACAVPLRSIGLGIHMYIADYNEWLPVTADPSGITMGGTDYVNTVLPGYPHQLGALHKKSLKPGAGGGWVRWKDYETDAGYVDDIRTFYCPGRKYGPEPFANDIWDWNDLPAGETWEEAGYAGYSYHMPNTTYNYGNRNLWTARYDRLDEVYPPGVDQRHIAWAACYRDAGLTPQYLTHSNKGCNTLYSDGSVLFVNMPEAGFGGSIGAIHSNIYDYGRPYRYSFWCHAEDYHGE